MTVLVALVFVLGPSPKGRILTDFATPTSSLCRAGTRDLTRSEFFSVRFEFDVGRA